MSLIAERPPRTSEPATDLPTSARPWRVVLLSLALVALCGWVFLPLFLTAGLPILALTILAGAAAIAAYLAAAGPPDQ
jgi:hypothetical protein